VNINHDPKTGEFTSGGAGGVASHADKVTFHREQQALHLKRADAAKRAWIKIRANKAAKQAAKDEAPAKAAALDKQAQAQREEQAKRQLSAAGHREQAQALLDRAKDASQIGRVAGMRAAQLDKEAAEARALAAPAAKKAAAQLEGVTPDIAKDNARREERLQSPIVSMKNLPGETNVDQSGQEHVSVVRVATLANGDKAAWKPATGERTTAFRTGVTPGQQSEREVAAWEIAKVSGMQDMVSSAVLRVVKGERGAMIEWQQGQKAAEVPARERYDGTDGMARAAAFDYVIGNGDRHAGNWIVNLQKSGPEQLRLFDHGLALPSQAKIPAGNHRFIDEASAVLGRTGPSKFAAPYVKAEPEITRSLRSLGLNDEVIGGVSKRIHKLENAELWADLKR
jgi:hypothetical protein